jgi:CO/xanthine dehydrogenase FAD-binding subunit
MRGQPSFCDVHTPATLGSALFFRAEHPDWKPIAGGTDLMVPFAAGRLAETRFLNLWGLAELRGIEVTPEAVTFGALLTFREIALHPVVRSELPNLVRSAKVTGALAIQSRGTLGGNLVNASPAADTPPSLLAYAAEVELCSRNGARWVEYEHFHTGYKTTLLGPDELLTRVRVPRPLVDGFHYFRKVGTRKAQAIAKVSLAAWARAQQGRIAGLRLGLGSVAPFPIRARKAEAVLLGAPLDSLPLWEAQEALQRDIAPIDDLRSSARYRRRVAENLLEEMLRGLVAN